MHRPALLRSAAPRIVLVGLAASLATGTAVAAAQPQAFTAHAGVTKPSTVKAARKAPAVTKAVTKKAAKVAFQPASKRTGKLDVALTANRHGQSALSGRSLSGPVYISYVPVGTPASVTFRLDNRAARTDTSAPFDLLGGSSSAATALEPAASAGNHTVKVTVQWAGGGSSTTSAAFRLSPRTIAAQAVAQSAVQPAVQAAGPVSAEPVLPSPPSVPVLADGDFIPANMPGPTSTGTQGYLAVTGSMTITAPGTYANLDVHGHIDVLSAGVTLTNVKVDAADADYAVSNESGSLLTLTDCDLGPEGTDHVVATAVKYSDYTMQRCNVHGTTDGLTVNGNVDVEDSWIHGLYDPDGSGTSDGIVVQGSNVQIVHSTVASRPHDTAGNVIQGASAITVQSALGPVSDVQITDSALLGDPLYLLSVLAAGGNAAPSDVSVTSNILAPKETAPGAADGYVTDILQSVAGGALLQDNTTY